MALHCLGVGEGHRKGGADASGGTNGAEEIGAVVTLVGRLTKPRSALGPLAHEAVLLADAGFVLTSGFPLSSDEQGVVLELVRSISASVIGLGS
jgi:hypothetical protein